MNKYVKIIGKITIPIISFVSGISAGKLLERKKLKPVGTLRIDHSEKNEPEKIFLELECDVKHLSKQKEVVLKVLKKDYIP
jgi:hypothetical protein